MAITLIGLGLIFGPWATRMASQLAEERRGRIRSEARAEMAAHLHDSVLHTLALIQRTDASPEVVGLARRQERELRAWLYRAPVPPEGRLRPAVEEIATRVEQRHNVPVDVVVVGDAPLDDAARALVDACQEAAFNAARHSGAPLVSVYVEVEPDELTGFVRDEGKGSTPRRSRPTGAASPTRSAAASAATAAASPSSPAPGRAPRSSCDCRGASHRDPVFLVDDHHFFLSGLRAELGAEFEIVGEAGEVDAAVDGIRRTRPDVVLLDVHLPGGGGRAVLEAVRQTDQEIRFLALSVSDAAEDVIGVIRAGARGYVTKIFPARPGRRHPPGPGRRRRVLPRLAGFVLDAFHGDLTGVVDPSWTSSPPASARSCGTSPAASPTRRSPAGCTCR